MTTLHPDKPLLAVFDLGMRLNELRWHLLQAVFCYDLGEAAAAKSALERLEILAVRLFMLEGGGDIRELVKRFGDEWVRWLDSEHIRERVSEIYASVESGRLTTEDAMEELALLVPAFDRDIEAAIVAKLNAFPAMLAAMQLGRAIDQGRHVPWPGYDLLELVENPVQGHSATSYEWSSGPRSPVCRARSWSVGELRPATNWRQIVQTLWERTIPNAALPQTSLAEPDSPSEREEIVRQLVDTARAALSETACPGWEPANQPSDWPPDTGWHFHEAEFALSGSVYALPKMPCKLLKMVKEARRPLTSAELDGRIWEDEPNADRDPQKRLRRLVGQLNARLKSLFNDAPHMPQVRGGGKGSERRWSIAMVKEPATTE